MVAVVEEELEKLTKEMESDDQDSVDGISPTDLILAADTADGKVVFDEVDSSLVDTMKEPEVVEETPLIVEEPAVEEVKEEIVTHQAHTPAPEVQKVEAQPMAEIFNDEAEHRNEST